MLLITDINDQLKEAMKAGATEKRDTLRFLQSALKNVAIEKRKPVTEFTDSEVQEVVKRLVKQRKDSIEQYKAGGRPDLVAKEEAELVFLTPYLPTVLSREATEELVGRVLSTLGTVTVKDMGKIMGAVMKESNGQADGNLVREIVNKHLSD